MNNKDQKTEGRTEKVNMSKWIGEGWDLVTSSLAEFALLTLIYLIVVIVASSTAIGQFLVVGPLNVGFFYIIFEKMGGREIHIGDMTKGFNFFLAAVLSNILITVFVGLGFILCIIPALIIGAVYLFTPIFILEKNMDFWAAMEASRKLVSNYLFEISVFVLVQCIIILIGALVCGIGLLVAFPVVMAATAVAYNDLTEVAEG